MIRHLTASAAVISDCGTLVLLVHHKVSGVWVFPGGHVEKKGDWWESPAECAVREVLEATGVHALLYSPGPALTGGCQPCPFATEPFPEPAKPERPGKPAENAHEHVDMLFVGTANPDLPTKAALDEVADVRWQPIDRLHELNVRFEVPKRTAQAARLVAMGGLLDPMPEEAS